MKQETLAVKQTFLASLHHADCQSAPYRHWLLDQCLPTAVVEGLLSLPFQPPRIDDTQGKRETHNSTRVFFGSENRAKFDLMEAVAETFQDEETIGAIQKITGVCLEGTSLRIEYCQDSGDFWLEPHTDIGAKKFTFLIYLNDEPEAASWGTDIYSSESTYFGRAPAGFNKGLIFIPGNDTWHGFVKRSINGVRKSLIINYVGPEWQSRHELCYPMDAIGTGSLI